MKTKKILALLLFIFSITAFAQDKLGDKKEQIKALKIAFITDELALTSDEATKFWPLFNAFEKKQTEIRIQKMKSFLDRMDDDDLDKMSDKEANNLLQQMETTEDDLYQNKKKFVASLKGIISPIKIIKLKKAEDNFNRKLLKQYRDKRRD